MGMDKIDTQLFATGDITAGQLSGMSYPLTMVDAAMCFITVDTAYPSAATGAVEVWTYSQMNALAKPTDYPSTKTPINIPTGGSFPRNHAVGLELGVAPHFLRFKIYNNTNATISATIYSTITKVID